MYNHNKAQQSKNRVHISWDMLYVSLQNWIWYTFLLDKNYDLSDMIWHISTMQYIRPTY